MAQQKNSTAWIKRHYRLRERKTQPKYIMKQRQGK